MFSNFKFYFASSRQLNKDFKGYSEMVLSTLQILSWTDVTNKAVFTCHAKNQEGDAESRKAVITNGIIKNFWLLISQNVTLQYYVKLSSASFQSALSNERFTKRFIYFRY